MARDLQFSSGLRGLDAVLTGLRPGDNVVWQIDEIADYSEFVEPFCVDAKRRGHPLVYFRFGDHEPLVRDELGAHVHVLRPEDGFEGFISEIFDVIEQVGRGACYVFDCLTDLGVDWYSDRMLGNFFMLTCPYLFSYDTITYFALRRHTSGPAATDPIHQTAQVVIDVFRRSGGIHVHPIKVYRRHSDTMYMLHAWEGERFTPVTKSATISEIRASLPQSWLDFSGRPRDVWTRAFAEATALLERGGEGPAHHERVRALERRLVRMIVTRDPRLLALAERYLTLEDLVDIRKRMIGTGLIGGKSAGMLMARAILRQSSPRWQQKLEVHDSFYIGSDVFYTYLVVNKCWWVRRRLKNPSFALEGSVEARQRMAAGTFPGDVQAQFMAMLDYFGQSPIIVRSSSLLEDAYGNAFSGKYDSVFCANQGTPEQRLEDFMAAVRGIYASTMSREALEYRMRWGLLDSDEQMALLVQRVSGEVHGQLFYPEVGGVGFSYNPFVWSPEIEPDAGFLRLVFGLGTRAVDRLDDDYTRVVSLSAPHLRPEGSFAQVRLHAQRRADVLSLPVNQQLSLHVEDVIREAAPPDWPKFASRDLEAEAARRAARGGDPRVWVLTFDGLLSDTEFVSDMRELLSTVAEAYRHPVDIEFTLNFVSPDQYRIDLLQCRPFQVRGSHPGLELPPRPAEGRVLLRSTGPVIGHSRFERIERLIYVVPEEYSRLAPRDRYAVAKLIGRVCRLSGAGEAPSIMLVGPGRWGTSTPELGVPVTLADINTVCVLCECALMHEGLVPDVSLGSHFFNDLVELDMLYLAVHPERAGHVLDCSFLASAENQLAAFVPDAARFEPVLRVVAGQTERGRMILRADAPGQDAALFVEPTGG